ncbi:hypothetical protein [Kozakia baliensis]|uniref:hypothetical protein n=1 Tax=Kozakia baliensis TaxID=153496 RepID=UPI00087C4862|nr:hypothetical protein [Kozakia baliensis]AOX19975.1 hypothetical protein A0U90_06400 [Kozakia baliensis]
MTNTTKQPSAIRSRDEQIDLLARTLEVALFQPYKEAEKQAAEFILEAEQRARMEKSGEAVAWVPKFDLDALHGVGPEEPYDAIESTLHRKNDNATLVPLYATPQTDAQAEKMARLEAENERLRDAINKVIEISECEDTPRYEACAEISEVLRAALTSDQKENEEVSHD